MTIEIRNSVYTAAYGNGVGMCLDFICHGIFHEFLFLFGFVPLFDRAFKKQGVSFVAGMKTDGSPDYSKKGRFRIFYPARRKKK